MTVSMETFRVTKSRPRKNQLERLDQYFPPFHTIIVFNIVYLFKKYQDKARLVRYSNEMSSFESKREYNTYMV